MKTSSIPMVNIVLAAAFLFYAIPFSASAYMAAPVANTKNPTFITEKSALMNGSVNSNETADTYTWFEWGISGRSAVYESTHRQFNSGAQLADLSENLYGLAPGVQYFYRVIAESSRGRDTGITTYFTTKTITEPIDPVVIVETRTATNVVEQSALLRGYIAPHEGNSVHWWFEWGVTSRLENATAVGTWGADSGLAQFSVTNLTPGTTYYYRIAAENTQGISRGGVQTFTTHGIAPTPSEVARAQNVATPIAGGGVNGGYGAAGGQTGSFSTQSAARQNVQGNVIPGGAYYPATTLALPSFSFASFFGGNKTAANTANTNTATNPTPSTAVNPATQVASVAGATPLSRFWNSLTGKKAAAVSIEKIGPSNAPVHTPVEYRITYAYRQNAVATNAKLKVMLPGSVVYIGDNTNNELLLEEGSGPERTYVLPIGRLEEGSTRTISILGMTTGDANGTFPDARARLEFVDASGATEVASSGADGKTQSATSNTAAAAKSSTTFSIFPSSVSGWLIYILVITLLLFLVRKGYAVYMLRKEEIAREEEENNRNAREAGLSKGALPA